VGWVGRGEGVGWGTFRGRGGGGTFWRSSACRRVPLHTPRRPGQAPASAAEPSAPSAFFPGAGIPVPARASSFLTRHATTPPKLPQAIPGLSPVPWWGTLFPLAVVLTVNGVKEAFDDYWRHVSDAQVNRRCGLGERSNHSMHAASSPAHPANAGRPPAPSACFILLTPHSFSHPPPPPQEGHPAAGGRRRPHPVGHRAGERGRVGRGLTSSP
jgi:hypothetical protein